jgi:tetratricopeptide (TPR) repeat protein
MKTRSWGRVARAIAVPTLMVLLVGCSSKEERAENHLVKAKAFVAEGRLKEAKLELQSALRFAPLSVEARSRLAELEFGSGNLPAALSHVQEAHQIDPTNSDAALHFASLLKDDQPQRAKALIEAVIEREPNGAAGYIGRSELALADRQIRAAGIAARKAMEVAPDDPRADWQHGYVLEAMIREGQLTGRPLEDSVYESAIKSFERYIVKGGSAPWNAQLEQARVMAAWTGHGREAATHYRTAVEHAIAKGSILDKRRAAALAAGFAASVREHELLEWSLVQLVELAPHDYRTWRRLAELRSPGRGEADATWQDLIERLPGEPRPHIEYARFMISEWRLDEALAYLEERAAAGIDPATLLSAIASTQLAAKRIEEASKTVARLERDHPSHPRTILSRAQLDIRQGQMKKATRSLRRLVEQYPDPDVYLLLARAEGISGNPGRSLAAVNKAISEGQFFNYEAQRERSGMLADRGKWDAAIRSLLAIRDRMPLSPEDEALLARCRYENGQELHGKKLLERLLARPRPPAAAVIEYARREGGSEEGAKLARAKLSRLARSNPPNWAALEALTRLDADTGRSPEALERLDQIFERDLDAVPPAIRLLRGRLAAAIGREPGTLDDARTAFEAQPRLRGSLELLVALYLREDRIDEAIAASEEARRVGAFDSDRRVLLGRLYQIKGRNAEALQVFEKAVAEQASNPSLYFHLGLTLRSLDRTNEATEAFEKALSISTNFPEADEARRALEGAGGTGAS